MLLRNQRNLKRLRLRAKARNQRNLKRLLLRAVAKARHQRHVKRLHLRAVAKARDAARVADLGAGDKELEGDSLDSRVSLTLSGSHRLCRFCVKCYLCELRSTGLTVIWYLASRPVGQAEEVWATHSVSHSL